MKSLAVTILLAFIVSGANAGCVFCDSIKDGSTFSYFWGTDGHPNPCNKADDDIYYDESGIPYRAPIAPDQESPYGYFEDGTKIPPNIGTPQPSLVLERMKNRQPAKVPFDPFAGRLWRKPLSSVG